MSILLFIPIVFSISCVLRSNSCNSGEFCLFSRYQQDNSHVGNCSAYSLLTCCSDPYLEKVEIKSSCGLGENGTISMFNYTNAHAEIYTAGNYDYKVCVSCPWFCSLRTSCLPDEYNLASLNASTNAHIASPGYYGLQVCCKRDDIAPTASNIGQNSSSIQPGQAVKIYVFWQDNGNLSHAILETNETGIWQNKSIYGSPLTIKANSGWSNFTWQNSSISNRVVGWRVYANDTCGNWHATDINSFNVQAATLTQCQNITSPGTYVLTNDVSASGTCFNITADLVELDCNGKRIDYAQATSGYGVYVDRRNNVTVKNCRIFGGNYDYSYGIYLNRANYTRIEGNNVSTGGYGVYGVFVYSSSNNSVVGNNVSTGGVSAHGVFIFSGSNNNNFVGNNVSTRGVNAHGLAISLSSNNTISQNKFYTYNSYAVYVSGDFFNHYNNFIDQTNTEYGKPVLYYFNKTNLVIENNDTIGEIFIAYSNYTSIKNVTLDKDGVVFAYTYFSNVTQSRINTLFTGVWVFSGSNNSFVGNNVSTGGDGAHGVYVSSGSNNNNFVGNNVSTGGSSAYGVFIFSGSNNNNFVGNNVSTGGNYGYGVYVSLGNNTNLANNFIKTTQSSSYGIYVYANSFNITLINNTIQTSSNDIRFRQNSSMQIINTSFNKSSVFWEPTAANAWINVSYYVDVLVRNFTNSIDSAQVNITNYTNSLVFSGYTSSDGYITTQILPEFFANGTYSYSCPSSQANLTCASPYNFSASKGSLFNSTIETVNQSKTVEIILFQKILTISLSQKLSEGIFFTNINGSKNNTQLPIEVDKWNNATWNYNNTPQPGDKKTLYWIYNDGNVNQDFCIKANADLTCNEGSCIGNTIPIMNVAFTNSTQNDQQNPSFSEQNRLSTSFIKIATNVQPGEYRYFRFWLYGNLTGKPSGIYNTTYTVRNVESGSACQ
ncbi:MAG: NosD domain-containing protein [Candidatus Aenigmatarchaeota archaeon]